MKHHVLRAASPRILAVVLAACVSHAYAAVESGPDGLRDTDTNLNWTLVDQWHLNDATASGMRVATASEFKIFLGHVGWTSASGPGDQFVFTGGASTANEVNIPPLMPGGSWNYRYESDYPSGWSYFYGTAGFLEGGEMGVVSDERHGYNQVCSGGRLQQCSTPPMRHTVKALVAGSLSDLKAGTYDTTDMKWSAVTVSSGSLKPDASQDDQSGWMYHSLTYYDRYFMVSSAVPEPSTWALMGLGLMATTVAARRSRRS